MSYTTLSEAYLGVLRHVWTKPQYHTSPRGFPIRERVDYTFDVTAPTSAPIETYDTERNKVIADYTARELELFTAGSCHGNDFANLSKFWSTLLNPDGTINSNYGYLALHDASCGDQHFEYWDVLRSGSYNYATSAVPHGDMGMRTPFDWARGCLEQDKDTRQAVLQFAKREHFWKGNKDLVCTMHLVFRIRNDELQCSAVLRSNDVVKGTVYDCPFFIFLHEKMLKALVEGPYPNLKMGRYTHYAHSLHIYERDKSLVLRMLGQEKLGA